MFSIFFCLCVAFLFISVGTLFSLIYSNELLSVAYSHGCCGVFACNLVSLKHESFISLIPKSIFVQSHKICFPCYTRCRLFCWSTGAAVSSVCDSVTVKFQWHSACATCLLPLRKFWHSHSFCTSSQLQISSLTSFHLWSALARSSNVSSAWFPPGSCKPERLFPAILCALFATPGISEI